MGEAFERHDWEAVERLTRKSPDPATVLMRVRALDRLGKVKQAVEAAEQAGRGKASAELSLEHASLLVHASRFRSALEVVSRAERGVRPPLSRQFQILRAAALSGLHAQAEPRALLEAVAADAHADGDARGEAESTAWLVLVAFRAADLPGAVEAGQRALALLSGEPSLTQARVHRHLAVVYGVQRRYVDALEQHRRAIALYRSMEVKLGEGREYLSLGLHYLDMGESELAEHYIRKGLAIAESSEDETLLSLALSRLGTLALSRARPEQALKAYERDLALVRHTESPRNKAFPLRNVGRALAALGRIEEALVHLRESAAIFEALGDRVNLAMTLLDQAIAEASRPGKAAATALESARRGRALLEESRRSQMLPHADLAEAHARLGRGERDAAEALFSTALSVWSNQGNVARAAEACLRFGSAQAQAGDRERARSTFERALDLTVRGSQPELTSALLTRIDDLEPDVAVLRPLRSDLDRGAEETAPPASPEEIVGTSPAMVEVRRLVGKVAPTRVPVLVTGESGVGKELVARAIHGGSPRRERPLVIVNCGAIPAELVESELFGHVRGAFTGALRDAAGKFAAADGGTLFLDEVGDLPLAAQVKLLRFLQSGEIQTVGDGAARPRHVDVRVLAATHRDLAAMAAAGAFRQDLLFRLNVFPLHVPALRERRGDIPALVRATLNDDPTLAELGIRGISNSALLALRSHDWPGNVRELQSALVRAAVLASGGTIVAQDLPDFGAGEAGAGTAKFKTLAEVEREHVRQALARANGNQSVAAQLLGVHRNTLRKRLADG
ncbi:MAG TPA: sigma 54-interacting transcriptional regulator [Myxococcales bacterium]